MEVITQDNQNQSVDLERECLDFMNRQGWLESRDFVFRINTSEDHEALNRYLLNLSYSVALIDRCNSLTLSPLLFLMLLNVQQY
jgi:NDP-sugar pyrophosphorylase family protein